MVRNLRTFLLALVATVALGAVAAATASAQFEAESAPVTVTPSSNNTQTFTYQKEGTPVNCSTVGGEGFQSGTTSTEFNFAATLGNCSTSFGAIPVAMNGCSFAFTAAVGSTTLATHIVCPAGREIEKTVTDFFGNSVCTLHIPAQTPGGTITASRVGSGTTREIKFSFAMTGIAATRTGSALCGPASSTTGTYSGEVTFTGENPSTKAHIGVFMD